MGFRVHVGEKVCLQKDVCTCAGPPVRELGVEHLIAQILLTMVRVAL